MRTPRRLIEPCCGSAALTLHLLGARKRIVPYQGNKWRLRKKLAALLFRNELPGNYLVADAGPWSRVIPTILFEKDRRDVLEVLRAFDRRDPRSVFDFLQRAPQPMDLVHYTAEFLFLQRLAFSGKAVGTTEIIDRHGYRYRAWLSPGFNETSAYGKPATDKFGEIRPMIPSLIATLRGYTMDVRIPAFPSADLAVRCAREGDVVYLDPPYADSTSYPDGDLSRREVIDLAREAADRGAFVAISEAEPIGELLDDDWHTYQLDGPTADGSPFRGGTGSPEYITMSWPGELT